MIARFQSYPQPNNLFAHCPPIFAQSPNAHYSGKNKHRIFWWCDNCLQGGPKFKEHKANYGKIPKLFIIKMKICGVEFRKFVLHSDVLNKAQMMCLVIPAPPSTHPAAITKCLPWTLWPYWRSPCFCWSQLPKPAVCVSPIRSSFFENKSSEKCERKPRYNDPFKRRSFSLIGRCLLHRKPSFPVWIGPLQCIISFYPQSQRIMLNRDLKRILSLGALSNIITANNLFYSLFVPLFC